MRQQSTPPLLRLPPKIRKRIYFFAGLIRECPVAIIPSDKLNTHFCPGGQRPAIGMYAFQLRKSTRSPVRVANSDNCLCPRFPKQLLLVCKQLHREVEEILYGENKFVLRAPKGAENLNVLCTISTNAVRSLRHLLVRLNSWPFIGGHRTKRSQQIIKAWENVCGRLGDSGMASGQLHLEFVCDVEDLQTAQRVLKPLERLPCLKQCSIRLGRKPDRELRSLARTTSEKLTRKDRNAEGFRFFDLPQEIRLQILRHTITGPGSDSIPNARTIRVRNGKFDDRYHLAGFHPLELFLTSRQMYLDASEIFYSEFQFHFQGHFIKTQSVLEKLPARLLKRLRRITFELDTALWKHFETRSRWPDLIGFLGKHCNPSNLLISITMTDNLATDTRLSKEDRKGIMQHNYNAYVEIVRTVKELLPDLRDFHLSFSIFWKLETVLEKFVMGPDYDSSHGNRYPKPRNTKWENSNAPEYLTEIPAWHTDVQEL